MEDKEKIAETYLNEALLKNQEDWDKIQTDLCILGMCKYHISEDGKLTRLNPLSNDEPENGIIVEDTTVDLSKYIIGADPVE